MQCPGRIRRVGRGLFLNIPVCLPSTCRFDCVRHQGQSCLCRSLHSWCSRKCEKWQFSFLSCNHKTLSPNLDEPTVSNWLDNLQQCLYQSWATEQIWVEAPLALTPSLWQSRVGGDGSPDDQPTPTHGDRRTSKVLCFYREDVLCGIHFVQTYSLVAL